MPKSYRVGDTEYQFPDEFSDSKVQDILSKQGVIQHRSKAPHLKGKIDENSKQNQILQAATGVMLAGPTLFAPGIGAAGGAAAAAAGGALKTGMAGLKGEAEGFTESMRGVPTLRGKVVNIGDAIKRAGEIGKLRIRQANQPPRPSPAWRGVSTERAATPEVNPIAATETPTGRAPGKTTQAAPRKPIWKDAKAPAPAKQATTPKETIPTPQTTEAKSIAQAMHETGITVLNATTRLAKSHWNDLFKSIGLPPPNSAAINEVLEELRAIEKNTPSPKGRLSPPQ